MFDAVALCGGGAKGAYQIGAWKALEELGLFHSIRAFSGSSIGGLNAVLFALNDFDLAKKVWYSVREYKVFSERDKHDPALFSREGMVQILRDIPLSRINRLSPEVYVNVFDMGNAKMESILLNQLPEADKISILCATSAIPVVYKSEQIKGRKYIDGGISQAGKIPIAPLYNNGYRNILVISLDEKFDFNPLSSTDNLAQTNNLFSDAHITVISPINPLGTRIVGTLDFSPLAIRDHMLRGYQDSLKILKSEDVYSVKNDFGRINVHIRSQMEHLFSSGKEIERFINTMNFSEINIEMKTMEGKLFYKDIVLLYGWRVQQHIVIQNHYRIIDPDGVRRAWVLNPDDIVRALDDYATALKFG